MADSIDVADALASRRRGEVLAAAIAELEPLDREVLLLRDINGLSAPQAAAEIGVTVAALKSRLHRARSHLRDRVVSIQRVCADIPPRPEQTADVVRFNRGHDA